MQRTKKASRLNKKREEELLDISDISCPDLDVSDPTTKKSDQKRKKRQKFSHAEDIKMLKYIMTENRYDEIKGIALWRRMELLEVTSHTSQSMKYHFLKTVIPNLKKYNVEKGWIDILSNTYPDLVPSPCKESSDNILDSPEQKKYGLRRSSPKKAANKALSGLTDLQSKKNSLQQEQEEEEEEEIAESNKTEADDSEDELNDDEELSSKQKQRKHKIQRNVKAQRKFSTSESEIEDASIATSTKETDHCVPNQQNSLTEELSDTSDYDRNLIDMAKKTVSKRSPSQERLSESSSSSEEAEQVQRDRRSRLLRKRKRQKQARQSIWLSSRMLQ
ncbi:uncharacterized protein DDB_G0283697 isoform X2 [Octopus bimaculoides]|uniref:uncharacterized protein DDB_G0283697 isoform X2 n=1 Tax=Octopus bimaculoides TaxID=37653 RepID=UPI0022E84735|nr:uncharacterized protein DDB_G0283697 isoform X2 [Octopus bimaculoides]